MNVPFRIHIIIQELLVMFQFLPSVCEENSHHIALYLITPPFPPQVQVRPVTPVTSICQVSWSRLCIWHDLFWFLSPNSLLLKFFSRLFSYSHLIHLVLMLCHHRRRSLKWQPENMSSLKADINIWPNMSFCLFVFWDRCLYLCLTSMLMFHRSFLCE